MSARATELRKGTVIEKDGDLLLITEYKHHTPGNLRAIIQMKTKSLKTGSAGQIRAGSGDTFEVAFLERKKCQYLYREGNGDSIFMDEESFEQFPLPSDLAADSMGYVKENTSVEVTFHENRPIGLALPPSVVLEVTECEIAVKGNTATNVKKDAVVETGLQVKVPLHIKVGELIKISTDNGDFMGRASE
ncbi:MAG: elongation factor P [Planctomycetes bacterium]|nr:elongation factor P [Planctomycetota bacterium]